MSEPDYIESYQLDELTTRIELLEALHAGGLAVAEQHAAMVRELRQLSSYLGNKGCRESLLKVDWNHSMEQIDRLLAWVQGDAAAPHVKVTEVVGEFDGDGVYELDIIPGADGCEFGRGYKGKTLREMFDTPRGQRGRFRVTVEFWPED